MRQILCSDTRGQQSSLPRVPQGGGGGGGGALPARTCRELRGWRLKEEKQASLKVRGKCSEAQNPSESADLNPPDPDTPGPGPVWVHLDPPESNSRLLNFYLKQEVESRRSRHGESTPFFFTQRKYSQRPRQVLVLNRVLVLNQNPGTDPRPHLCCCWFDYDHKVFWFRNKTMSTNKKMTTTVDQSVCEILQIVIIWIISCGICKISSYCFCSVVIV